MGNSLSKDLRDRALATYDRGGRSIASVARQLGIAPQTLGAWLRRRRETGSAEPLPHAGGRSHAKIQPVHERALETYIEADCSMTLPEMAARLSADHQLTIDPSQLSRVLARLGYTRKKKSWVDPRVDRPDIAVRRAVWAAMATLLRLGAPHIVHVDESGFDLAMAPAYGRSKRGARCRARRKRRTQRFTLIAACGLTGWRAARLIRGGMDRDSWVAWVREQLAPRLAPGTIVLLDNLKIHYDAEGLALLEEAGASVLFQPPYSPEANPIEEAFSKVKSWVRRCMPRATAALREVVNEALSRVTESDFRSYFAHSNEIIQTWSS